jgi:O-antigen/teichoic acid export membrane protein
VTGILLARKLGPDARGELAAVYLWPTILATIGLLGIGEAVTFETARRAAPVRVLVGTSVAFGALQGVVLAAVGAAIFPFVFSGYSSRAHIAAFVFLVHIPLWSWGLYLTGIVNGLHRTRAFQVLRVLPLVATAAGLGALAVAGALTVLSATLVYAGADLVLVAGAAAYLGRRRAGAPAVRRETGRTLLRYGIRSHPATVSGTLNELLDKVLIAVVLGSTKLGLYTIAVTMASVPVLAGTSIAMVALPALARLEDREEQAAAARRYLAVTAAVGVSIALPAVVFAHGLLVFLFGPSFASATTAARILLVAAVVLGANYTLAAVLRALNRPTETAVAQGIALGPTVVGLAIGVPLFGITGAAVVSLVAYVVALGWMWRRTRIALGVSARGLLLPPAPRSG